MSRPAITKRVGQLEAEGKIRSRREGNSRLVDLAAFDRAVGEVGNAIREEAASTSRGKTSSTMRDAQTERAQYDARLKALDLAERQRQLLPIAGPHGIEAAAGAIAATLARDLDGLIRYADEVATAISKEGVAGARRVLKEVSVKIRQQMADSLARIAEDGRAVEREGLIETELPDE